MYIVTSVFSAFCCVSIEAVDSGKRYWDQVQGQCINNIRFADDIVLLTETEEDLQTLVIKLNTSSKMFALIINRNRSETEVKVINRERINMSIRIDRKLLNQVVNFIYLGGVIFETPISKSDIKRRVVYWTHSKAKRYMELQSN